MTNEVEVPRQDLEGQVIDVPVAEEAIHVEVVDEDKAPLDAEEFYLIEIFTNDEEPLQFRSTDPQAAQKTAEECASSGKFTATINGGIEVFPVNSARVTGPYVENPVEV